MSTKDHSMYVILPKGDSGNMLILSIIRRVSQLTGNPYRVAFVNSVDKRTLPNPNVINNKTWLYLIGNLPDTSALQKNAFVTHSITSSETKSAVAVFWEMAFRCPIPVGNNLFHSFERVWLNSPDATEEDRGLRSILHDLALKAETSVKGAFQEADVLFCKPDSLQQVTYRERYDEDLAKLVAVISGCVQFTLYVTEEVLTKCQLPAKWLGKIVRFVDTTGVMVDTGLLAYYVGLSHPEVDILVQHRLHQLQNNVCHRYYCRAIKEVDLLAWNVLSGHPRAASGQVTKVVAPFSDHAWMESIDSMPFLA